MFPLSLILFVELFTPMMLSLFLQNPSLIQTLIFLFIWILLIVNPQALVLGFIILPCPNQSIRVYFPNLGVIQLLLGPLVPLGTLGLMGPHVPVTKVWGTLLEVSSTYCMCMHQFGHLLDQSLHFRSHGESRNQPTSVSWSQYQLVSVSPQLLSVSQHTLCMDNAWLHLEQDPLPTYHTQLH